MPEYTLDFCQIGMKDISRVGGKNASLGEMFNGLKPHGVGVLDGFATTAEAFWRLVQSGGLAERLRAIFANLDVDDVDQLAARGHAARTAVLETPLPAEVCEAILEAHGRLCFRIGRETEMAIRSSATAEDLPEASFAGAAETFLNVRGEEALVRAVHNCYASLFTDRAISYRAKLGYDQLKVAISVGVMPMIRSDKASSGVVFTLDLETGFRDATVITASYGLGEFVVQGVVTPDEWTVFKPALSAGFSPIIGRRQGTKEVRLVYGGGSRTTRSEATPAEERKKFSLTDDEVLRLARWASIIEDHYSKLAGHPQPMDIEWAKDGITDELFIVQARPETVHSAQPRTVAADIFLEVFDGFSIGSNDLTQLVLGIDRDSGTVSHLFDERNGAVLRMIEDAINAAHRAHKPIGICGQAPSDYPEFATWLVGRGIHSISLNPDVAIKTALIVAKAEAEPRIAEITTKSA